jgi:hypothetical protein
MKRNIMIIGLFVLSFQCHEVSIQCTELAKKFSWSIPTS